MRLSGVEHRKKKRYNKKHSKLFIAVLKWCMLCAQALGVSKTEEKYGFLQRKHARAYSVKARFVSICAGCITKAVLESFRKSLGEGGDS